MPDIGQIKGTNIKRGNSGLDPKIFDLNKELLDAMRIIARQEIDRASRDITKNALVRSVNSDGSVNITLEGKEFNKIPNYTVGTVKENDVVKVTYPQNQASNIYVSGGTSIDEIINNINNSINLINIAISNLNNNIQNINTELSYKYFATEVQSKNVWELIYNIRGNHGQCGSVNFTETVNVQGVNIPANWYNYLWIPHRNGGMVGDNFAYGTLLLFPMIFNGVSYICRYTNESIASVRTFG